MPAFPVRQYENRPASAHQEQRCGARPPAAAPEPPAEAVRTVVRFPPPGCRGGIRRAQPRYPDPPAQGHPRYTPAPPRRFLSVQNTPLPRVSPCGYRSPDSFPRPPPGGSSRRYGRTPAGRRGVCRRLPAGSGRPTAPQTAAAAHPDSAPRFPAGSSPAAPYGCAPSPPQPRSTRDRRRCRQQCSDPTPCRKAAAHGR